MKLYHSNDLEVLKEILLAHMRQNPPSLFEREALLVQSQGMAHWLRLNVADGLGVAAQLDFPLPSSFVWQVFNHLNPGLPARSHFDKQLMAWKLMRLLPTLLQDPCCAAIAHYLEGDGQGLRRFQLARNIADLFDQYLVYRPDWLLHWELGGEDAIGTDVSRHPWQPMVWRALVEDARSSGQSLDHRARLLESLPELVKRYPERLSGLPRRLFIFGISALPGSYWQVLQAISPVIEVHFFLLNPCRNFWGDIVDDRRRLRILQQQPQAAEYLDRGNPLLASWGRLGRDFLTLVHDTDTTLDVEAWVEPQRSDCSLLRHIQLDILELQDRQQAAYQIEAIQHSQFKQVISRDDESLRLVSAHSPLREVQHLHDQLLFWLDRDPTLKPRDVVVMVPDIDLYAPYIDAVFASAATRPQAGQKDGSTRIPWAIADQSLVAENPVLNAFLGLLGLPDSRLLITEVQDWLDVAVLRGRFEIAEDELEDIRDWLARAQVRWGLDGQQRQGLGLPAFEQNSWRKGLRQLLLGLMVPDRAPGWLDDWPVVAVEGTRAALLGKLLDLLDSLEYWQTTLATLQKTSDWVVALPQLVDAFFAGSGSTTNSSGNNSLLLMQQMSVQRIRDLIARWQEELELSQALPDLSLSAAVVRSWFGEQLGQQGGWQRFLAGPVNFCTLMPMRSIPFRVVCLLGMNDSDYPRSVPPVSFDLMASGHSRRGDRSRREDDRYLFLEALCSAQQHLYISYRGRDARENSELQPSVLVSELLDYVADSYCLTGDQSLPHSDSRRLMRDWLLESLPLQVFSTLTCLPQHERGIGGYQPLWARVAAAAAGSGVLADTSAGVSGKFAGAGGFWQQPLPLPPELADQQRHRQILWEDVKTALRNGAEFFVRRRLRANLTPWWQEHPTEEPFALDGLDGYWLKSEQLQILLNTTADTTNTDNATDLVAFVRHQQALGNLPVRALGEFQSERLQKSLRPLCQSLQPLLQPPVASASLLWPLDLQEQGAFTILGELQQLHGQVLVRYRPGSVRAVHLLDAWLDLLLVTAVQPGRVQSVHYLGVGKEFQHLQLLAPSPETAEALIHRYAAFYLQCWCQPSDCLPGMLWAGLTAGDDPVRAADAVRKQGGSDYGELNQPAVKRCLPGLAAALDDDEQVQEWIQQHRWVLDDLLAHLTDVQKERDQQEDEQKSGGYKADTRKTGGQKETDPARSATSGKSRRKNTARKDEDA